jgi:FtsZ-binding cell division protein ZapB
MNNMSKLNNNNSNRSMSNHQLKEIQETWQFRYKA